MSTADAHLDTERRLARAQEIIDRLRGALRPFAEYSGGDSPDELIITRGSPLARQQLTIRQCRDAALALLETGIRV